MTNGTVACTCLNCGKVFEIPAAWVRKGGGKYCSKKCRIERAHKLKERVCKGCGKTFTAKPGRHSKFCSLECFKGRWVELECPVCHKTFKEYRNRVEKYGRIYCSLECSAASQIGENSNAHFDRDRSWRGKNWRRQRSLARERDGNTCQICGATRNKNGRKVHVHHIVPYHTFNGNYFLANQLSNLICLCSSCHRQVDAGKPPSPKRLF